MLAPGRESLPVALSEILLHTDTPQERRHPVAPLQASVALSSAGCSHLSQTSQFAWANVDCRGVASKLENISKNLQLQCVASSTLANSSQTFGTARLRACQAFRYCTDPLLNTRRKSRIQLGLRLAAYKI